MTETNGYQYSKAWFSFAFENGSLIKPVHGCLYLWLVELNNRKGWCKEFPAPASGCMQACGIHSYNTYKKSLEDLEKWGFIKIVTHSKNQYTSNIIGLSKIDKAPYKAIDKAFTEQLPKQRQSTSQSIDSNLKQETIKQLNLETSKPLPLQAWENLSCKFSDKTKDGWLKLCATSFWKKKELHALELSLKKIIPYKDEYALVLIENSIANGYRGIVFGSTPDEYQKWLKTNNNPNSPSKKDDAIFHINGKPIYDESDIKLEYFYNVADQQAHIDHFKSLQKAKSEA